MGMHAWGPLARGGGMRLHGAVVLAARHTHICRSKAGAHACNSSHQQALSEDHAHLPYLQYPHFQNTAHT